MLLVLYTGFSNWNKVAGGNPIVAGAMNYSAMWASAPGCAVRQSRTGGGCRRGFPSLVGGVRVSPPENFENLGTLRCIQNRFWCILSTQKWFFGGHCTLDFNNLSLFKTLLKFIESSLRNKMLYKSMLFIPPILTCYIAVYWLLAPLFNWTVIYMYNNFKSTVNVNVM